MHSSSLACGQFPAARQCNLLASAATLLKQVVTSRPLCVQEALELTPDQCDQMIRVRQDFLLAIRHLVLERHALAAVMQSIVPGCDANVDVAIEHHKVGETCP